MLEMVVLMRVVTEVVAVGWDEVAVGTLQTQIGAILGTNNTYLHFRACILILHHAQRLRVRPLRHAELRNLRRSDLSVVSERVDPLGRV